MSDESPQLASFALLPKISRLPPSKRYITTHTPSGKSTIHSSPPHLFRGDPTLGGAARSYAVPGLPAHIANDSDISAYLAPEGETSHTSYKLVNPRGVNMTVVELEPGGASQLHRTVSVDFVVVTNGHVQMQTDAGDVLDLFPGDVVVQRATMHRWSNPSEDEAARFVAVIVPAEEFEVPGLGKVAEEHVAGTEVKGWNVSQLEK